MSFLSVSVLLFVVGTDLSLARVGPFEGTAFLIGAVQFTGLAAAGLGIAYRLDYARTDALYLGLALAASSTIVGVRLLQHRQQMFEPFGRTVLGVLFGFMGAAWLNVPLFVAALFAGAVLGGRAMPFMDWFRQTRLAAQNKPTSPSP